MVPNTDINRIRELVAEGRQVHTDAQVAQERLTPSVIPDPGERRAAIAAVELGVATRLGSTEPGTDPPDPQSLVAALTAEGFADLPAAHAVALWASVFGVTFGVLVPERLTAGHDAGVNAVAWSPGGEVIASGTDRRIWLWNPQAGSLIRSIDTGGASITSLSWCGDGTRLASGDVDGAVLIWDTSAGRKVQSYRAPEEIWSVAWKPDGTQVVWVCSNSVTSAPPDELSRAREIIQTVGDAPFDEAAWSPTGNAVAVTTLESILIITTDGIVVELTSTDAPRSRPTWSPDGRYVASALESGAIQVWDAATGAEAGHLSINEIVLIDSPVYSPAGAYLAVAADPSDLLVVDLERRLVYAPTRPPTAMPASGRPCWSPEGDRLAVPIGAAIQTWVFVRSSERGGEPPPRSG